ncbi:hypothetical protein GGI12_001453 [Dipsacomyces acuminosporus]|nr:hypothetical protein GGI12_001453 [Dipsacomyces acuminosporus]
MARRIPAQQQQQQQQQQPPKRTLWAVYKGIEPRYRILLGLGFMGFSMAGLWVSDKLEEIYPVPADNKITHISHDDTTRIEDSLKQPPRS